MENKEKKQCPEFPFLGARYPDATCIDGYLWDLDSGDKPGLLSVGGDTPCPFCNTEKFIADDIHNVFDGYVIEIAGESEPTERQLHLARMYTRKFYLKEIEKLNERYGK